MPGDYDGDGDTDVAVYRPANGGWYVRGVLTVGWGGLGDIPLAVPFASPALSRCSEDPVPTLSNREC